MTEADADAIAERVARKLAEIQSRPTLSQMALAAGVDGWKCPRCGCEDWRVVDSRFTGDGRRRTRVCRHCKQQIQTVETASGG
jgi:hypothetical protein